MHIQFASYSILVISFRFPFFVWLFAPDIPAAGGIKIITTFLSKLKNKLVQREKKRYSFAMLLGRTETIHFRYFVHFAVRNLLFKLFKRRIKCFTISANEIQHVKPKATKKWKERTAKVQSVKIYIAIFSLFFFFYLRLNSK